jgi:hypothetical protein
MLNSIGKGLVLVHTTFSLMLLGWALVTYLKFTDLGWKEPNKVWETKDTGFRIASELDKRTAALYELYRARERSLPAIKPALDQLVETMDRFPKNHLFYVDELKKVESSPDPIQAKAIKSDKSGLNLDTPGKAIGKPILETPIAGIDKSLKKYQEDLKKLQDEILKLTEDDKDKMKEGDIPKLVKSIDEITIQLYGTKDKDGNTEVIGLLEILEKERIQQDKVQAEKEYITPIYVDTQRRLESFLDRFRSMQKTLQSAKK